MTADAVLRLGPLPVSGQRVILRPLTGAEDQLLLEAPDDNLSLALTLLNRLGQLADNPISDIAALSDWGDLPATDLDILILRLRQMVLGNRIRGDVACGTTHCEQRIDVSFGIDEYIAHYAPVAVPGHDHEWRVEPAGESGWFRLLDNPISEAGPEKERPDEGIATLLTPPLHGQPEREDNIFFRIPTAADQLAIAGLPDAAEALARRCVRPAALAVRKKLQVEAAMESMAPSLSNDLLGVCPECGAEVKVYFDVRRYCLRELKEQAAFVYEDTDVLARRYHWAEADILALPRNRRMTYAELARQEEDR
jgi:hypothetical protein